MENCSCMVLTQQENNYNAPNLFWSIIEDHLLLSWVNIHWVLLLSLGLETYWSQVLLVTQLLSNNSTRDTVGVTNNCHVYKIWDLKIIYSMMKILYWPLELISGSLNPAPGQLYPPKKTCSFYMSFGPWRKLKKFLGFFACSGPKGGILTWVSALTKSWPILSKVSHTAWNALLTWSGM